jgi:tetratricopeptide (TPR) repeat protein
LQGVGAGNWKINAPYYYSGYHFTQKQLNWLRPHNDYLWVFAEKGILGILSFLGIFIFAIYYLIHVFFASPDKDKKVLALFILAGLIAYLSVSFFSFPLERPHHQVYLALWLSLAVVMFHEQKRKSKNIKFLKPLLIVASLLLVYFIIYASSVLVMETRVKQARILERQGRWEQMLALAKTIPSTFRTIDAEAMPVAWYQGVAYANLNQVELANQAYQKAYKAHPTRISLLNNLGRTYFQLQDYENAKVCFLEALAILPEYFESLVNISSTYIQLKDYEKAYEYLSKIKRKDMNEPLRNNLKFVQSKLKK